MRRIWCWLDNIYTTLSKCDHFTQSNQTMSRDLKHHQYMGMAGNWVGCILDIRRSLLMLIIKATKSWGRWYLGQFIPGRDVLLPGSWSLGYEVWWAEGSHDLAHISWFTWWGSDQVIRPFGHICTSGQLRKHAKVCTYYVISCKLLKYDCDPNSNKIPRFANLFDSDFCPNRVKFGFRHQSLSDKFRPIICNLRICYSRIQLAEKQLKEWSGSGRSGFDSSSVIRQRGCVSWVKREVQSIKLWDRAIRYHGSWIMFYL